ncbi:MAG: NADPH-dependent assimilatory sulfite reductase hemoprotein subunit [Alphaproteobacteria bacterium]|nr:NADPH-dependent assimilatory sulfite reductase hemoprotein subunit [Alphaproteobacteria bacterium]
MADKRSPNEIIKDKSRYLRGTIAEGLSESSTGAIAEDDTQLTKFHGIYQQDDRDLRAERRKKKVEKAYSFMVRVRVPGGVVTPAQWLAMDRIADVHANGTIRLTTRQAFQFHGIIKSNLKASIQAINDAVLDTIAACGDVNRNVMCNPLPEQSPAHAEALQLARDLSAHLTPRTPAYAEIWLDGEKILDTSEGLEIEPIYGKHYLPRKFKTVIAIPPSNDVDIYAHDLGYVAIVDAKGVIEGYTVTIGGGMGMTHGEEDTYPCIAQLLGFCTPDQAIAVAEAVVTVQRDYGNRENRKHARLKYTLEDRGLDWFRTEVEKRLGYKLAPPRAFTFTSTGDRYGWTREASGLWAYGLFVQNGRIADRPNRKMKTGLARIANDFAGDLRLTANQNLIIAGVAAENKPALEKALAEYGLANDWTGLRLNSMACVALPTCGLALAESERYLPDLIDALDRVVSRAGLTHDAIVMRMSGCPNGCSRPFLAEIGLVGRTPGRYNLYLGAAFDGSRLNKLFRQDLGHEDIINALTPLIEAYARERSAGESFGDYVIRKGIIRATTAGRDFHTQIGTAKAATEARFDVSI